MRKQISVCAAVAALSVCGVLAAASQQQPVSDAYQWAGELVSFDAATRTVTVKARLVNHEAEADLKRVKAQEPVVLAWSGFERYADGIRRVLPPAERKANDRFVLPTKLVSTAASNEYVTFRIVAPASSVSALQAVKPGEWVTVVSLHRPAGENDAIVSIKPYTASSTSE
jgi:hypothetical protein